MKKIIKKVKISIKKILRFEVSEKADISISTERLGSDYGGWTIEKGSVSKETIVYSFGVGEDVSFDIALIEKYNAIVHAFDPTPKSIEWVKDNVSKSEFILHEYGISDFDGEIQFNPPTNPDHISHTILDRNETHKNAITVPVRNLATIMHLLGHNHVDILKMDIEGAEYDVVENMIAAGIFPNQLLIEYHHRFSGVGITKTSDSIQKLREVGYALFSISETNEEYSFKLIK